MASFRKRLADFISPKDKYDTPKVTDKPVELQFKDAGAVIAKPVPKAGEVPSWEQWLQCMEEPALKRAGWSPGRMGVRLGHGIFYPYGALRGDYGVFTTQFNICTRHESAETVQRGSAMLTSIVHLPTGVGLLICESATIAQEAVDAILEVNPMHGAPQLSDGQDVMAQWSGLCGRTFELLRFHGFCHIANAHCHPPGDEDAPIWTRNPDLAAGKPEVVS